MHCICQRDLLSAALGHAAQAVSSRAAMDVLKGILFECGDGILTVTGRDTELAITAQISADVREKGDVVLDARMISEMVRRSAGDNISIQVGDKLLTRIASDTYQSDITALSPDGFPALPEVTGLRRLEYAQPVLKKQLSEVLFAVSDSEAKLVHTGVLFEAGGDSLRLVALDGHRLAVSDADPDARTAEAEPDAETYRFIIPGNALQKLEKMLEEDEESRVTFHIGARHALIAMDNITVVPRLLEGDFFNYRRSIPQSPGFEALLPVRPLIQCLERVGLLVADKLKNPLRLRFEDDLMRISCITALGSAQDELPSGTRFEEPLEIGFNYRYLLDALRRIPTEKFRFLGTGPSAPCLILPESGDNPLYVVLPIRLGNNP